jgi:hypothetical protein
MVSRDGWVGGGGGWGGGIEEEMPVFLRGIYYI